MIQIKSVGNYAQCPYCEKLFGNGISIVYSDVVKSCSCDGMREVVRIEKLEEAVKRLRKRLVITEITKLTQELRWEIPITN